MKKPSPAFLPITGLVALSLGALPLHAACPVSAGNCETSHLLTPSGFGSQTPNLNLPLLSGDRLNPSQDPTTNNWQNLQRADAIDATEDLNFGSATGVTRSRAPTRNGITFSTVGQTGPGVQFPLSYSITADLDGSLNLTGQCNITNETPHTQIVFSAEEAASAATPWFDVATDIQNSETVVVTYTPKDGGVSGTLTDYTIMGNPFHDVYYDGMTPLIGCSIGVDATKPITVDGVDMTYTNGGSYTGKEFVFHVTQAQPSPYSPYEQTLVMFVENAADTTISLSAYEQPISPLASDLTGVIFQFTAPYTGFIRFATVQTDLLNLDPVASVIPPSCDFSTDPACQNCPIEDPTCTVNETGNDRWWKAENVMAIAPSAITLYLLLPTTWSEKFGSEMHKIIPGHWTDGPAGYPSRGALSITLVPMALASDANFTIAQGYYTDMFSGYNLDPDDDGINLFLNQFNMYMGRQTYADAQSYQSTSRQFVNYHTEISDAGGTLSDSNALTILENHRRYIPTSASLAFNHQGNHSAYSWTYTISPVTAPLDGSNKTLCCFPLWKYLTDLTSLQPMIYNTGTKGTVYVAEAVDGVVAFEETDLPSWFLNPTPPDDGMMPDSTAWNPDSTTLNTLNNYYTQLLQINPNAMEIDTTVLNTNGYGTGKELYRNALTARYLEYLGQKLGTSQASIKTMTQPWIDVVKSTLNSYLISRPGGSDYFVFDQTNNGICFIGNNPGDIPPSGMAQTTNAATYIDFGNALYNDHHFQFGYFLLAAAIVVHWDNVFDTPTNEKWINLQILGADLNFYPMRQFVDMIWRDCRNPFNNDPVFPFNRYGNTWEGHGSAQGFTYVAQNAGRIEESIAEDFHSWLGCVLYARNLLQDTSLALTSIEKQRYAYLLNASLLNLRLVASSGILWFKNDTYWIPTPAPGFNGPLVYQGVYANDVVTTGNVQDNGVTNDSGG